MNKTDENQIKDKKSNKSFLKKIYKLAIPLKGDTRKQVISKIIFLICLIAFIVSSAILIRYVYEDHRTKKLNDSLREIYQNADDSVSSVADGETMLPKFEKLFSINNEIVGWVDISDSTVSYPVLQTGDNDYYLKHDFEKKDSRTGAIFADFRYKLSPDHIPDNTVVYGHYTKSGAFFGALHKFRDLDYLKSHPVINFDTLTREGKYKIFAVFITNADPGQDRGVVFDYHNRMIFNSENDFKDFYDNVMLRNFYKTDVDVKYGDELLTLSTCSQEFWNGRLVIVARRVRDGESETTNSDSYLENPDKYMPIAWYEVMKIKPPR